MRAMLIFACFPLLGLIAQQMAVLNQDMIAFKMQGDCLSQFGSIVLDGDVLQGDVTMFSSVSADSVIRRYEERLVSVRNQPFLL